MMQDFTDVFTNLFQQQPWVMENTFPIFELGCLYKNEQLLSISRKKMHEYGLDLFHDPSFFNLNIEYVKPLMECVSELKIIHTNKLLIALEQFEKKNNGNAGRKSEIFTKLVDAACCLDFENINSMEYAGGPANSHLFA